MPSTAQDTDMSDTLTRVAEVLEARKGAAPDSSYAVSYTHLTLPTKRIV